LRIAVRLHSLNGFRITIPSGQVEKLNLIEASLGGIFEEKGNSGPALGRPLLSQALKRVSSANAATFALLTAAVVWGGTFVVVKVSIETIPPLSFVFGRFLIAFVVLAVVFCRQITTNWRSHLPSSLFLGVILFSGFVLQVWGLQRTSASDAGFITGISVVLVAVLDVLANNRRLVWWSLLGLSSAVIGLSILSLGRSGIASIGNVLVLACAVAFGLHVFYTDRYSKYLDARVLTTQQIGVVALLALGGAFINGELNFAPSSYAIAGLLYTGVLATALAYFFQTWAQKRVHATHSAIVLAAEPVFAAIFAVSFLAESTTVQLVAGGMLVTIGMIFSSLRP
jgi:drug/metabolite transporter (DMT)-like permease